MIPPVVVTLIDMVQPAGVPGVDESDYIRWMGVAVGVIGVILATPEGLASICHSVKQQHGSAVTFARRLLHIPKNVVLSGTFSLGGMGLGGTIHAKAVQPWVADADADQKIEILHEQVGILDKRIDDVWKQIDQNGRDWQKKLTETEGRVTAEIQKLSSEVSGERSRSSRVDARGFGPIAFGVLLAGLPDELATIAPLGWLAIGISAVWVVAVAPRWVQDFRGALGSAAD